MNWVIGTNRQIHSPISYHTPCGSCGCITQTSEHSTQSATLLQNSPSIGLAISSAAFLQKYRVFYSRSMVNGFGRPLPAFHYVLLKLTPHLVVCFRLRYKMISTDKFPEFRELTDFDVFHIFQSCKHPEY